MSCLSSVASRVLLGVFLLGAAITAAAAGELKLSTVRLDLNDRQPSAALTVTNVGTEKSLVHLRLMSWTQGPEGDVLTPSTELLVNPPIAEIAANARQLVRIGYSGKMQKPLERPFRLIIEEVPRPDRSQTRAVETYLRISVPLFIAPLAPNPPRLTAQLATSGGAPRLVLENIGGSHARVLSYTLSSAGAWTGPARNGPIYVLPEARAVIPLDPADRRAPPPGAVEVVTGEGAVTLPLRASP